MNSVNNEGLIAFQIHYYYERHFNDADLWTTLGKLDFQNSEIQYKTSSCNFLNYSLLQFLIQLFTLLLEHILSINKQFFFFIIFEAFMYCLSMQFS